MISPFPQARIRRAKDGRFIELHSDWLKQEMLAEVILSKMRPFQLYDMHLTVAAVQLLRQ